MAQFTWEDAQGRQIRILSSDTIPLATGDVVKLQKLVSQLHVAVPLTRLFLRQDPGDYLYFFDTDDGRRWLQRIIIPASGEASMTFAVSDHFAVSEFLPHRELRIHLIAMVQQYQITLIDVTWL